MKRSSLKRKISMSVQLEPELFALVKKLSDKYSVSQALIGRLAINYAFESQEFMALVKSGL